METEDSVMTKLEEFQSHFQSPARGPKPRIVEFQGVGHAPMLLAPDQYGPVVDFLRS